jgi:hypothetical protein
VAHGTGVNGVSIQSPRSRGVQRALICACDALMGRWKIWYGVGLGCFGYGYGFFGRGGAAFSLPTASSIVADESVA